MTTITTTRNLAVANRSRVGSAYKVTTVNFQRELFTGGGFSRGRKHMLNLFGGSRYAVDLTENREICTVYPT